VQQFFLKKIVGIRTFLIGVWCALLASCLIAISNAAGESIDATLGVILFRRQRFGRCPLSLRWYGIFLRLARYIDPVGFFVRRAFA